jgi:hypothetical protein
VNAPYSREKGRERENQPKAYRLGDWQVMTGSVKGIKRPYRLFTVIITPAKPAALVKGIG